MWRRRVDRLMEEGPSNPVAPEMWVKCFKCMMRGHYKAGCTFKVVCMRCGIEGHVAKECKRPRSPASEDELRRLALAKVARREAEGVLRGHGGSGARSVPPPPPPHRRWLAGDFRLEGAMEEDDAWLAPLCFVRRSASMDTLEHRLRFAMVAHVGGSRPAVSCDQVAEALAAKVGVSRMEASVHAYALVDFLVVFAAAEFMDRVAARPHLEHKGFELFFSRWNTQAQATGLDLHTKVHLVVEGIPPHAWETETAVDLLGTSCVVDEIAPETFSRADLSAFRLTAWTPDIELIPVARRLVVPEPVREEERTLSPDRELSDEYKILIHLDRVEEDVGLEERWRARSADSGQSGIPDPDLDSGDHRNSYGMPWRRGVPDRLEMGITRSGARASDPSPGAQCAGTKLAMAPAKGAFGSPTRTVGSGGQGEGEATSLAQARGVAHGEIRVDTANMLLESCPIADQRPPEKELVGYATRKTATVVGPSVLEGTVSEDLSLFLMEGSLEKDPEESRGCNVGASLSEDGGCPTYRCASRRGRRRAPSGWTLGRGPFRMRRGRTWAFLSCRPCQAHRPAILRMPRKRTWCCSRPCAAPRRRQVQILTVRACHHGRLRLLPRSRPSARAFLKALASPLLKEIDAANKLRAEAEPFTPKRVTRSVLASATFAAPKVKKGSAAESVLMRALGITPDELTVTEENLQTFRRFFDSPCGNNS
ncbi:unnamed protein product [Alopecurus aequalis]